MKRNDDFPDNIQEEKSINIALITGVFIVVFLTFLDMMYDILETYTSITPFLWKFAVLVILVLIIRRISRSHSRLEKLELKLKKMIRGK